MKIAQVIVDVSTYAVNRPFDYALNEDAPYVEIGSRVKVPFGRRDVIGYVVGLKEETDVDPAKLKPISEVVDYRPALTEELVELAQHLAHRTICYEIDALQAMLPAAMRTSYERLVVATVSLEQLSPALRDIFESSPTQSFDSLTSAQQKLCKDAALVGEVEFQTSMKQQTTIKTERVLHIPSLERLRQIEGELSNRAHKQKQLLAYLMNYPNEALVEKVVREEADVAGPTIQTFVTAGYIERSEREVYREIDASQMAYDEKLALTTEQQRAFEAVRDAIDASRAETFLLHGITGSGKTEVYLQAIERVLERGEQAIVLVPEIALTPQMTARFKGRFGDKVAVMHSALSQGEKYDEWRKIRRREVSVVVGARSAIFAPFTNLGLLILDEEHESTYKQEDVPRYHARDVAIWRGNYHQCPVLLGSATPALESFARAQKGVYTLLSMTERPKQSALPEVSVVDMREELRTGNRSMYSHALIQAIRERMERGEQIVLFLNRRGFASFMLCRDCGTTMQCPHCDISLTYHRSVERLKCHYCNYETYVPPKCPHCESESMRFFGTGTQKAEVELKKVIPDISVIRMDVDTTSRKGAHEKLLSAFGRGEAQVLLGTQMIAKGLDFPNITLVGVLAADSSLHLADFRASERTFQLLTQVSGRAGRAHLQGEVIVQTYAPEHYSIQLAKQQQYIPFYNVEMQMRKRFGYPPMFYIVALQLSHASLEKVIHYANQTARFLRQALDDSFIIVGPAPSLISRVNDRYRYQCLIKYKAENNLFDVLHQLMHMYRTKWMKEHLRLSIQMEPQSLM